MTATDEAIAQFRTALADGAEKLRFELSDAECDALNIHYRCLAESAPRLNLTSVWTPREAASIHFLDSLLYLRLLDDVPGPWIDFGAGAGFPGLVLAAVRPRVSLTLVEPRRKRASFLRWTLAAQGRTDVTVHEARATPAPGPDVVVPAESGGAVVARATWPAPEFFAHVRPYVAPGGVTVFSGGGDLDERALAAEAGKLGFRADGAVRAVLPTGQRRHLVRFCRA